MLMVSYKFDLDDPAQRRPLTDKINETVTAYSWKHENAACVAAMFLYGPGGANVPNLLSWKNSAAVWECAAGNGAARSLDPLPGAVLGSTWCLAGDPIVNR
ncbi:MAG: hypothetical protein NTV73_05525 [Hyphomicrobiales bacterium]|nr:hypothetical protein [Hyphomicrobiales bacterium]